MAQDISSLLQSTNPYSVSANVGDKGVDASTSTVTGNTGSSRNVKKELGKDDFLLLLTTQLRFQDPLNPMDNTQFIAQLAQFQSLEANNNIGKSIDNLNTSFKESLDSQKQSANMMAGSAAIALIGKTVRMEMKNLAWDGTQKEQNIPVATGAQDEVNVEIQDEAGNVVRTLTATNKDGSGFGKATWDGKNDAGKAVDAGTYLVKVVGQDKDSSLYAFVDGTVEGVSNMSNGAQVRIAGVGYELSSILDISETKN